MPETSELMDRPTSRSEIVKKRALEIAEPKIARYLGADWHKSEREHILGQIAKVMSSHGDGYSMARELENRHGWSEDRYLVDLMDEVSSAFYDAEKELVRQWIRCYQITPERKIGDRVSIHVISGWVEGVIVKIMEDEARYGVRTPEQPPTSHWNIEYERTRDA